MNKILDKKSMGLAEESLVASFESLDLKDFSFEDCFSTSSGSIQKKIMESKYNLMLQDLFVLYKVFGQIERLYHERFWGFSSCCSE